MKEEFVKKEEDGKKVELVKMEAEEVFTDE